MAPFKLSVLPVIILVGVVLGALGYLLGSLITSGTAGARAIAEKGPGSMYEQPIPVADFTLTDQTGQPFTLSQTRGKIVLMAFLYTSCGDVCPYLALKMKIALEQLGPDAKNVELVAVDTDPERDTVKVLADYSKDLGLYDRWHIVTGTPQAMSTVYKNLKVTVIKSADDEAQESVKNANELGITLPSKDDADSYVIGLSDEEITVGSRVARKFYGGYQIMHSAPFWVIDQEGNLRTALDFNATPAQLVEGVKAYLKPKS